MQQKKKVRYNVPMKTHTGGCQCGKVRYEAELDLETTVINCNCSICEKHGLLLTFIPVDSFKLTAGEDNTTEYRFHKEKITHHFCKTCGVETHGSGSGPEGTGMAAVNVRTVDDVDLSALDLKPYDGKSL
jgi:hypothetical protein